MKSTLFLLLFINSFLLQAQNSKIGDGFGGRLWYKPMNYTTGSYSAYTVCGAKGQLYGWGRNQFDQLGISGLDYSIKPIAVPGMDEVTFYSTGYLMTAIRKSGEGWVWGAGFGTTPKKVIEDVTFVDASMGHCSFIKTDGSVWNIGQNNCGCFGTGPSNLNYFSECQKMSLSGKAVRTACGGVTTYILCEDGTVWGAGMLPSGISYYPTKIIGFQDIVDIKANSNSMAALDKQGKVWTIGFAPELGRSGNPAIPGEVDNISNIVAISGCADGFHFLALDENKVAYAWGNNLRQQSGIADPLVIDVLAPNQIATDVIEIMAGEWFNYIVKSDYTLWANGRYPYIWLNQPDPLSPIATFLNLDPTVPEMGLCKPLEYTEHSYIPIPTATPTVTLLFPNAFSPNGDNLNDVFKPMLRPDANIESYSLKIFDRWGQMVFSTNTVTNGWNGQLGSKSAEMGTYFYIVSYNQKEWKYPIVVKEDLTLVR